MVQNPELAHAYAIAGEGRQAEALAIIRKLADRGDPEGLFAIAEVFWRGTGTEQDQPRARKIFAMAADAGNPMAVRAITNLMASGIAGPRDWPGALARLRAEAAADSRREHILWLIEQMALTPTGEP